MTDEIVWLNHAGYELRAAGLRIVHDPWLDGTAFDEGWALISPSVADPRDFEGVDYIWFSHEHPDHFSPALLRAIPERVRRTITILFQRTRDGRVLRFCRDLGFTVRELDDGRRSPLSDRVSATCGIAGDDSWLFLETPERTYLNLNDAVGCDWAAIVSRFGRPVDVLLAQFSYASGVAAPGETQRMRAAAEHQFALLDAQIDAARPRFVMPFASHIWFCRAENFHLNAEANRIDRTFARLRSRVETIALYPGDRWRVGAPWDSAAVVARYMADWARHTRPLPTRAPVPLGHLMELADDHRVRLARDNWLGLVRPLVRAALARPVTVHVIDLAVGVRLDLFGRVALVPGVAREDCSIEIESGSLVSLLRDAHGIGTLMVNGCFRELRPGGLRALSRQFVLATHNGRGNRFPSALLRPGYLLAHGRRALLAITRQLRPGDQTGTSVAR